MSDILKVFSPEQLVELMKNKIIADDVGLTNFNVGGRTRSLLEAFALIASGQGFDFLDALRKSIPIALYDGLGFTRKGALKSNGFLRFYRLPEFYIVYNGTDTSVDLDSDATDLILTTSGTPSDNVAINYATFTTITDVVTEIDSKTNWTAILVGNGTSASTDIFQYTSSPIVNSSNYLNNDGRDIMLQGAGNVVLLAGLRASIDSIAFQTVVGDNIAAGDATSSGIAAQSINTGISGKILAGTIDTLLGKGILQTPVVGIQHVKNDSVFVDGADAETDIERALRFQTFVQGLSSSTKRGLESVVLNLNGIKSVTVLERFPQPGTNTIIADDGSGNLSVAKINEILLLLNGDPNDLQNNPGFRAAGITINVQAPNLVPVNVTVVAIRIGTLSDEIEILNFMKSAIENYINTRRLGNDVVLNELRVTAMNAHPAIYDINISLPLANVPIGPEDLARTGSGTGASVIITLNTLTVIP